MHKLWIISWSPIYSQYNTTFALVISKRILRYHNVSLHYPPIIRLFFMETLLICTWQRGQDVVSLLLDDPTRITDQYCMPVKINLSRHGDYNTSYSITAHPLHSLSFYGQVPVVSHLIISSFYPVSRSLTLHGVSLRYGSYTMMLSPEFHHHFNPPNP